MKRSLQASLVGLVLVLGLALAPAHASVILSDGNSSVTIDNSNSLGAYAWYVDGTTQLFQQQYWYGLGTGAQSSIDTLSSTLLYSGTNVVGYSYAGSGFDLTTAYTLLGGAAGSKTSDLGEAVRINNTSGSTLAFRLYLYTDFDLGGIPAGDTASIDAGLHHADQSGKGWIADTVVTPDANHGEVNFWPSTLTSLDSGSLYTLNGALGPLGPGDMTWALEWDVTIPAGSSWIMSLDKRLSYVPVPPTALLLGSGLLGLVGLGYRRRKS
jgi:hypothetical protein